LKDLERDSDPGFSARRAINDGVALIYRVEYWANDSAHSIIFLQ
jgi:hypothetical protein